MTDHPHLEPGPDHPITVTPAPVHIVVRAGGQVVADTRSALALQESTYPVAYYIPRSDVDMAALSATDHSTRCPYKGEASYFSVPTLGEAGVNSVWSYENPYPAVSQIAEYLAFYPNRMDSIEVTPLA